MNDAQREALKYILMMTGAGALGGGLMSYMSHKKKRIDPTKIDMLGTKSPDIVEVPYPVKEAKNNIEKAATTLKELLLGTNAQHWSEVPWAHVGLAGGAVAGAAGGHALLDKLMTAKRKRDMQDELDEAEDEYKQTLLDTYDPKRLNLIKRSKVEKINEGLEKLAVMLKVSEEPQDSAYGRLSSWVKGLFPRPEAYLGFPLGLAGLAAVSIPSLTGLAAYNYYKNRSKEKLVEEAARMRAAERLNETFPEPYAQIESD